MSKKYIRSASSVNGRGLHQSSLSKEKNYLKAPSGGAQERSDLSGVDEHRTSRGRTCVSRPPQLVTGLDCLELSLCLSVENLAVFKRLESLKYFIQENDLLEAPFDFDVDGFRFNLQRTGVRLYPFVLRSAI